MKKIVFVVLMTAYVALPAVAAAAEKEKFSIGGNISTSVTGAYIDKLSGETLIDNAVTQLSIELSSSSGIYLIAEQYYDSRDDGRSFETDFYLGIEKEIGRYLIESIDIGYYFSDMKDSGADFHGPYLLVDFQDVFGIIPYLEFEQDISTREEEIEGGFLYRAGLKRTIESVGNLNQPIDIDVSIGGHDGAYGYRPETVSSGRITISTTFVVWRGIEIIPEINYQRRLGHSGQVMEDGEEVPGGIIRDKDKIWGGIKISFPIL